ncbi:hypothetical protein F2Q70_00038331 [Brassica cretica]|uniref:Uncharacterized protein n=1 Tax=Brassica cretica TaxID=69181 RepID=A0A8S9K256_BRACR|nr:hypothetical protein F2Q70_00038331 [Brassica cretica]
MFEGMFDDVPQSMDQTDQNAPDVPVEVHPSDQIRQTNRAVYRLDPLTSGMKLRPSPRPEDQSDRTSTRPSQPSRQAKANNLTRNMPDLTWIMPDLTWIMPDLTWIMRFHKMIETSLFWLDWLVPHARILKLSEDLGFVGTQLVRSERPAALADRPAYVLILTALDLAGSDASGQKPNGHFD